MNETNPKDKWNEFLEWIENQTSNSYYRGHSNKDYLLLSKVGRLKNYSLELELNLFEHFKRRTSLYTNPKNDYEWLALAQHHGLSTRLLDWTSNPLIACFFAVKDGKETDARLYAINNIEKSDDYIDIDNVKSPFFIPKIHFLNPPLSTRRIELQNGLFSIHPLPNHPCIISKIGYSDILIPISLAHNDYMITHGVDFKSLNSSSNSDLLSYQNDYYSHEQNSQYIFDIPSETKYYFENKLRAFGINESVFGDIDGISKNIEFQGQNNQLNTIFYPKKDYILAIWKEKLKNQLIEHLIENPSIFPHELKYLIFNNYRNILIENIYDKHYNHKEITGIITLEARPRESLEGVMNSFEKTKYSKEFIFFSEVLDKQKTSSLAYIKSLITYNFKIEIFTEGFSENIKITKVLYLINTNLTQVNMTIENYKSYQNLLNTLKSQIDKNDIDLLNKCIINSKEYNSLVEKYQNKIKLT